MEESDKIKKGRNRTHGIWAIATTNCTSGDALSDRTSARLKLTAERGSPGRRPRGRLHARWLRALRDCVVLLGALRWFALHGRGGEEQTAHGNGSANTALNVTIQTWTDKVSRPSRVQALVGVAIEKYLYYMFIRQTVPLPLVPSNTKKLAIGASRAASAFKISCPSIPPITAHTGENS